MKVPMKIKFCGGVQYGLDSAFYVNGKQLWILEKIVEETQQGDIATTVTVGLRSQEATHTPIEIGGVNNESNSN